MRVFVIVTAFLLGVASVEAQSLIGSGASMQKQFRKAVELDLTRTRDAPQVEKFVALNLLVEVKGNENYGLDGPVYPYARLWVRTFIERLSAQFRTACGEKLIVTSLTRPLNRQPRNASKFSVHPAGMSVDFRIPGKAKCLNWLERNLLALEKSGVIEATREYSPPHFHVAVFIDAYERYVRAKTRTRAKSAPRSKIDARKAKAPAKKPAKKPVTKKARKR